MHMCSNTDEETVAALQEQFPKSCHDAVCGIFFFSSVESSDISWRRKKSGGIKIICQSDMRDFSAMAFITDHVHSLIEQWFPGQCTALWICGLPLLT